MPLSKATLSLTAAVSLLAAITVPQVRAAEPPQETAAASTPVPAATTPDSGSAKHILADADKEQAIRQLIKLTGGEKIAEQMQTQVFRSLQQSIPDVPAEFWTGMRKKMDTSALIDRLLPIYDKYYSKEDVQGLIQFYQSPLGQKMIQVAPGIMHESYAVGTAWGKEVAEKVILDIQARQNGEQAKPQQKSSGTGKSSPKSTK